MPDESSGSTGDQELAAQKTQIGGNNKQVAPDLISPDLEAELESLPPELKSQVQSLFVSMQRRAPIPMAKELGDYEIVVPGSANRIIVMAEQNAEHRRMIENKIVDAELADKVADRAERRLGQIFGLTIGIVSIVAGAITTYLGHPVAGSFIGTSGVVGLVSVFVLGRQAEKAEKSSSDDDDDEGDEE